MKNTIKIISLFVLISSTYFEVIAQSDSTFFRFNILSATSNDSLYPLKIILDENIPELKAWDEKIKTTSKDNSNLIAFLTEKYFSLDGCDSCYSMIYVGENHPTHTVRLETFLINNFTKEILVYDLISEKTETLSNWRKRNNHF